MRRIPTRIACRRVVSTYTHVHRSLPLGPGSNIECHQWWMPMRFASTSRSNASNSVTGSDEAASISATLSMEDREDPAGLLGEQQYMGSMMRGIDGSAVQRNAWKSATPPPRRRVRQYCIPGLDDEMPTHDTAQGNNSSTKPAPAESAASASAPTASASTSSKKKGDVHERDAAVPSTPAAIPLALLNGQAESNKKLKKILIAALGADFAKAGNYSDGLRSSFSVVNNQTLKQQTGLKRIPSKVLISYLASPTGTFDWIDITGHPTATLTEYKESVQEVLLGLGMHQTMVDDSAEPMLLPQVTVAQECHSLLLRYAIDAPANKRMDSFQDLTNRFTYLSTGTRVITVHRTPCDFVEELKRTWHAVFEKDPTRNGPQFLLYYFVREAIATFARAISHCIVEFDHYEANLFMGGRHSSALAREVYHIKRRASVYSRTLTLTEDAYAHMASSLNIYPSNVQYQELQHDLAHVVSLSEELNGNADSVLQLLFQLSSYQVNELMRVLTLFSAFFIPLSFIASVYGMNFDNIPLVDMENGEYYCFALMASVAGCIFLWFKSKRFI